MLHCPNGLLTSCYDFDKIMVTVIIDWIATGANIKKYAENAGYSIETIMEACGVSSKSTVLQWFRGTRFPSIESLLILSGLFSEDLNELIVYSIDFKGLQGKRDETCLQACRIKRILELFERAGKVIDTELSKETEQQVAPRANQPKYRSVKNIRKLALKEKKIY